MMESENKGAELGQDGGPGAESTLGDDIQRGVIPGVEIPADEIRGSRMQSDEDVKERAGEEREPDLTLSDNVWGQTSASEGLGQIDSQLFEDEEERPGEITSDFEMPPLSPEIDGPIESFIVPDEFGVTMTPMPDGGTPVVSAAALSPSKILSSRAVPSQRETVADERPRYRVAEHVVLYKKAAKVVQNPLILDPKVCPKQEVTVWRYAGPDRALDIERATLDQYKSMSRQVWSPNTTATDPTRARKWRGSHRGIRGKSTEDWKFEEERTKEKRDHELALELGYETLVGNLLYIDTPHTKDIQRSWQNYLSQDKMEWGFPYYKGSTERPRMRPPEPYLAHQVVEKLWKYPKARMTRSVTEDQDLSTS